MSDLQVARPYVLTYVRFEPCEATRLRSRTVVPDAVRYAYRAE
jgi:hypothetical protein